MMDLDQFHVTLTCRRQLSSRIKTTAPAPTTFVLNSCRIRFQRFLAYVSVPEYSACSRRFCAESSPTRYTSLPDGANAAASSPV